MEDAFSDALRFKILPENLFDLPGFETVRLVMSYLHPKNSMDYQKFTSSQNRLPVLNDVIINTC